MPDHIVVKKNGKFEIVPSDADIARAKAKEDKDKIKTDLANGDFRDILNRVLLRLEALENSSR